MSAYGSYSGEDMQQLVADAAPDLNIKQQPVHLRYKLGEELGSGSYGRAVKAIRLEDKQTVVVKQIRLIELDEKGRQEALQECKVLSTFDHINVIHYYEAILENGVLNIVMEYAGCGDIGHAIQKRQQEKKPFAEDDIMLWFVQIVLALFHVHSKNVLHRDLKSQNIFVADGNILKLGDFGIARVLNSDTELARTAIGTPYYLSPEICEDRPYNRKSDVWALGCVLYELTTLKRAFDGNSLPALVVRILKGKYPPIPTRYSSGLRGLVEAMLKQNPKERPSVDVILRQDYVRGHVERYAAHVMAVGAGQRAALGLQQLQMADARPRPGLPSRSSGSAGSARPTPGAPRAARASSASSASAACAGAGGAGDGPGPGPHEASEAQALTPAEGASPVKTPLGAGGGGAAVRRSGAKLVDSGWMRQQQGALAELEGQLKGSPARRPAQPSQHEPEAASASTPPNHHHGGAGAGAQGTGPGLTHTQTATTPASIAGDWEATAPSSATTKAKLLELKLQRDAELEAVRKANAVAREQKKAALAKRTQEQSVAIKHRVAERQREMERALADQKAEMEAKARKALQLAAAIKAKEDARRKEAEEVAHHMRAHQEQVKAARAKINKEKLSELGQQFAARMASVGETSQGQVVVVDLPKPTTSASTSASAAASASPRRPSTSNVPARGVAAGVPRGHSPAAGAAQAKARGSAAGLGPGGVAGVGAKTRGQSPAPAPAPAPSSSSSKANNSKPQAPPPWKQKAKAGRPSEFPAVQIFTPFGSEISPAEEQEQVAQAAAAWAQAGQNHVLEVLAQIQTVLVDHDTAGHQDMDPEPGSAAGTRPGSAAAGAPGGSGGAAAAAAAANAQKVEQLRVELERELGAQGFLKAYRFLRELEGREGEGEEDETGGGTQAALVELLGPRKLHLARHIHKLITLEDAVFS